MVREGSQPPTPPAIGSRELAPQTTSVQVICRFPQNDTEVEHGGKSVATVAKDGKSVQLLRSRGGRFSTGRVSPVSDSDENCSSALRCPHVSLRSCISS